MKKQLITLLVIGFAALSLGYAAWASPHNHEESAGDTLVGAWQGKVQFSNGVLAGIKDLEFMYVFNAGGTMTESSNHDSAPPAPPAYGVWRKTAARHYEAKYKFFWTNPPKAFKEITDGGGWPPGGSGVLTEKITLSADGNSFKSTISFDVLDNAGKVIETGSKGEAEIERIRF